MVRRTRTLDDQTLFTAFHPKIIVTELDESDLTSFHLGSFLSRSTLGVACCQGARGILTHIAFATPTHVICICMPSLDLEFRVMDAGQARATLAAQRSPGRRVLRELLQSEDYRKLAFDMDKFAMALYHDFELTIVKGIDIQSTSPPDRTSVETVSTILGGKEAVHRRVVYDTFFGRGFDEGGVVNVALRAWAACQVDMLPEMMQRLQSVAPLDTTVVPKHHLEWLARFTRISWQLHDLKPRKVINDVREEFTKSKHGLQVGQTRFKTRMRPSGNQRLHMEFSLADGTTKTTSGRVTEAEGKSAKISVRKTVASTARLTKVVTIGKEPLTAAEAEREQIVLSVLQQKMSFFDIPLVRRIFFERVVRSAQRSSYTCHLAGRCLNESQAAAVERVISDDPIDQMCLVHGPPGTGKTTVIAASVKQLMGRKKKKGRRGIWLLAQSNVAVKNIAEKLASVEFLDFKILVSKDFHFQWHEHLYEKIERNIIRSDQFTDDIVANTRLLLGSKVILCTLSMISSPRFAAAGFTRIVPIATVIVDEASQIGLGDYIPLLARFGSKLSKLVFIGDDKQLAPFGQDDLGDLPSIFELSHLRGDALFLDTQYRMPRPIGAFISKHVYDGRLRTEHAVASRRSCILVDVSHGKETKVNCSWTNPAEIDAVATIVRRYHSQGKNFRVITPYDAQRNAIEKRLKDTKLPWENKCFNVDSFQGNEEDYIIISVVRSNKPGFLTNLRRTNVMLSRCKRGMVICTSREFMKGSGKSSLVGKLAQEWPDGWVSWKDVLQGRL